MLQENERNSICSEIKNECVYLKYYPEKERTIVLFHIGKVSIFFRRNKIEFIQGNIQHVTKIDPFAIEIATLLSVVDP